jgi:hypothetical protein
MMILEVRTNINAPASKIFSFFNEMQENYVRWHPDHVLFNWRRGCGVAPGNVFYFEEVVADEHEKKEVVFTEVAKDRYLAFAPTDDVFRLLLPRISFEMNEGTQSTELIAQVVARMGPIAVWVYRRKIRRIIQHMREEGANLKQLVETSAV